MYCEIYPLLEGNMVEFNFNIPYLRMIQWHIYDICTKRAHPGSGVLGASTERVKGVLRSYISGRGHIEHTEKVSGSKQKL